MLNIKVSVAYNQKTKQLYKNSHQYILFLIMIHKPAYVSGETGVGVVELQIFERV